MKIKEKSNFSRAILSRVNNKMSVPGKPTTDNVIFMSTL